MKNIFKIGDSEKIERLIKETDLAAFNEVKVHNVCSTFALAREIEWSSRQFVLKMKDEDEEGIGTKLTIDHMAPAFAGELLEVEAFIDQMNDNELICSYVARVGDRIVAKGITGQKVLKKDAIHKIFSKFGHE